MPSRSCCVCHWRQRNIFEESLALVIGAMGGERKCSLKFLSRCAAAKTRASTQLPSERARHFYGCENWWKLEFDRSSFLPQTHPTCALPKEHFKWPKGFALTWTKNFHVLILFALTFKTNLLAGSFRCLLSSRPSLLLSSNKRLNLAAGKWLLLA